MLLQRLLDYLYWNSGTQLASFPLLHTDCLVIIIINNERQKYDNNNN